MGACERIEKCVFFKDKMQYMPSTAALFKRIYCNGDNSKCARYMVFSVMGKEHVPADLFPDQRERALKIISTAEEG